MKKLLSLLSVVLLVFVSCSDNDNDSPDPILLKKVNYTRNGVLSSENIIYDGNKIVSNSFTTGTIFKYTYADNVIAKIVQINNGTSITTDYIYANGKLAAYVEKNDDNTYYKMQYTYNDDGTVSYQQFTGVTATSIDQKTETAGKYTFKDGNLIKDETSTGYIAYEYDTKINPFNNILGFNLLINEQQSHTNNRIKQTHASGSGDNITINSTTTYMFKYDENNFPSEMTESNGSNTIQTVQYFY